ncbi:MAG: hypothetical protein DRI90_11065, partial [Deltaproteobacteria bacterium]
MHNDSIERSTTERIAAAVPYEPAEENPFTAPVATVSLFRSLAIAQTPVTDDAPAGSYEYRMIQSGAALPEGAHETAAQAVEVRVSWGQNLLQVRHLSAKQSFYLGEEERNPLRCDFFVPAEKLGATRAPLVLSGETTKAVLLPTAQGTVTLPGKPAMTIAEAIAAGHATPLAELAGAHGISLTEGTAVRQQLDDIVFECSGVRQGKKSAAVFTLAALMGGAMAYV